MKSIITLILLAFLILPLLNAQVESLGEAQQNDCISLVQTCTSCNSTTYSNITSILYPDKTLQILNIAMQQTSKSYNYTWCNTSQVGTYIVTICTDVEGSQVCPSYDFLITKTGSSLTQAESNISTSSIYFLFLLGMAFIIFGLFMLDKSFWFVWVGIFSIVLGFIFFYYDLTLVNLYINSISISGSSVTGVFLLVTRMVKLFPYVAWLIVAFTIGTLYRNITKKKNSHDGWDNNSY